MFKIQFTVDKFHLAYKFWLNNFFGEDLPAIEWKALYKNLEGQFGNYAAWCFFDPKQVGYGLNWAGFGNSGGMGLIRDEKTVLKIFKEIFKSTVFKEKYLETQNYKKIVEKEWQQNSKWLSEFAGITGIKLKGKVKVFILHPELKTGSYIGQKTIEWGNQDLYKNYQFIAICHELLHLFTEKQFQANSSEAEQWLLHAIIYLAADEELRLKVNEESAYFMSGAVHLYHERLIETAKKILPEWKKYIAQKGNKNILKLFLELK